MQIVCCKCKKEYEAKFYKAEGINFPIFECPYCGLRHTIELTPFHSDNKVKEIESIDLTPYYADLYGTRILSIAGVDQSGADDVNVTNWTKTDEFIVAIGLTTNSKNTEASTYKLQWQDDNDGGGYVDLASDAGSPELSYTIADNSWAHGDAVATGDQKVSLDPGEEAGRVNGERIKNQSLSDSLDQGDENQSELWFGVNSNNADDSHAYSFQPYCTAEGASLGVCGATLTIAAGAKAVNPADDKSDTKITVPILQPVRLVDAADNQSDTQITAPTLKLSWEVGAADNKSDTQVSAPSFQPVRLVDAADNKSDTQITALTLQPVRPVGAADNKSDTQITAPSLDGVRLVDAAGLKSDTQVTIPTIDGVRLTDAADLKSDTQVTVPTLKKSWEVDAASVSSSTEISPAILDAIRLIDASNIQSATEVTVPTIETGGTVKDVNAADVSCSTEITALTFGKLIDLNKFMYAFPRP